MNLVIKGAISLAVLFGCSADNEVSELPLNASEAKSSFILDFNEVRFKDNKECLYMRTKGHDNDSFIKIYKLKDEVPIHDCK